MGWTSEIYEQFDKYNTRIRKCQNNLHGTEMSTYYEYDQKGVLLFKFKKVLHGYED